MARASDILQFTGTIGGMTFYSRNGKYFVRTKSSLNKARLKSDEKFVRTLELAAEFGGASTIGKYILQALGNLHRKTADGTAWNRMKQKLIAAIRDAPGIRGERPFIPAIALTHLQDLKWDENLSFLSIFYTDFTLNADASTGQVEFTAPPFLTPYFITPPEGANHFRLFMKAISLPPFEYNPQAKKYQPQPQLLFLEKTETQTNWMPLDTQTTPTLHMNLQLTPSTQNLPLVFIGIEFSQHVHGRENPFKLSRAMQIVVA